MDQLQILKTLGNKTETEDVRKGESENTFDLEALLEENYAEYYDEYEHSTSVIGMNKLNILEHLFIKRYGCFHCATSRKLYINFR